MNFLKTSILFLFSGVVLSGCAETPKDQDKTSPSTEVKIYGEMKNVMRLGKLEGTVSLDTLSKKNLYGIGPIEYLQGELMVYEGISYVSKVETDSTIIVDTTFDVKAPFFVYAQVDDWESETLPDSITNLETLENFLDEKFKDRNEPVVFKINGQINSATIHIVNLPEGSKVSSPEEAHQGIVYYPITQANVNILGFFSRKHQAVFTHHDTFMHLHLITKDREMMGHLDEIDFGSNQLILYWSN
jgi:acetolactate decarboxylase